MDALFTALSAVPPTVSSVCVTPGILRSSCAMRSPMPRGRRKRRAFRRPQQHVVLRLIVLRKEVLAHHHEQRNDAHNRHQAHSPETVLRCSIDQRSIGV